MIGGAKGIGIGIDFGIPNQYCRATSKSYIEKDVLDSLRVVASAYGKSNNDADRSIVKNLVDASNPFIISNTAFKLNSGFGKYSADFESFDWAVNISQKQHNKATISLNGRLCNHTAIEVDEMKVNIIGNVTELIYWYIANPDDTTRSEIRLTSGINTLPKSYAKDDGQTYNIGFAYISGDSEITIEQIPSFEGAFVTDGINDLITSTKTVQEMLGGSNEITVVSMIHLVKDSVNNVSFTNYIRGSANGYFRNIVNNYDKTGIYGYTSSDLIGLSVVNNILGDKNDYTANGDNRDSIINGNFSVQGYSYNDGNNTGDFSSVAWYWTIIANKVLTTDQINQVIAYFNLDRTLKSDIYCNIAKQGITNENHAEFGDKLIDFSGNGRDIQLNNIAWQGDSGIGKYETELSNTSIWTQSKETTSSPFSSSYNGLSGWIIFANTELTNSVDMPSFKIQVKGLLEGQELIYRYYDSNGQSNVYSITKDGDYTLPSDFRTAKPQISNTSGFQVVKNEANIITITQIPSHAGGLCLDGVNDFGKVTGMPIYKDYTVVTDREIFANTGAISSKNNPGAFLETAGNSVYSFGQATSGLNFISTRSISYLSKYSYCGQSITAGAAEDGTDMWLGTIRDNDSRFFNGAIYSLMSFPYSMSEFLIERQLKKHKLGTLYPDMVEFRPIVKSNVNWDTIEIWQGDKSLYRPAVNDDKTGIYLKKNSTIGIYVKPNVGQKVSEIVCNGVSYTDLEINSNGFYYKVVPITKSPQKINVAIEQDENYVKFEPVITSNVEYVRLDFYLNNYQKRINIGDYIPKDAYLRAIFYLKNNVDELTVFTFNGVNIGYKRSSVDDTAFNINQIYNYDSPQEVNITIDEYIRYEDIVQPYPVLLRFNDENGNEVSWGGKFRVGSTITIIGSAADSNLLPNIYNIFGLLLNGNQVTSSKVIVEKTMVFKAKSAYIFDNNEPKCILSPRLLRIPNSSYKILGHIPDISGHGNNGVIHNSAYAEGSGVNEDGSYQFDGVDDFVTIPTIVGGKQVLMKTNWLKSPTLLYDQRASGSFAVLTTNEDDAVNPRIAYQGRNQDGKTYIDGIENNYIETYSLKGITHNITVTNPSAGSGVVPVIGANTGKSNSFAEMSLYDFMLFDEISTDDKIQELNEYVGIEAKVELPPYYWDAYGKTNLDADKATIQQRGVAIGDYDLTNTNFAYDKMSGFGGYTLGKFTNSWSLKNNSNSISIVARNPYDITLKKLGGNNDWEFKTTELKLISNPVSVKFKSDKNIRLTCDYHYYTVGGNSEGAPLRITSKDLIANEDTIITISPISQENIDKYNIDINRGYYLIYFQLSLTLAVNEEVTIEMLPLYPNGLVYDGVEDFSVNKNIPIIDDFTVIAKRTWLEENISDKPFIIKGDTLYPDGNQNAFLFEYGKLSTYSFGQNNKYDESVVPSLISWATPTSYNGTTSLVKGSAIDTVGIDIAHATKMVLYKLILYPKTISLLEINFLKNLMEKDEIIDLTNPIFIQ